MDRSPIGPLDFEWMLPDHAGTAGWRFSVCWPAEFACPGGSHGRGWIGGGKPPTSARARRHRQTSVAAGTTLRDSKPDRTIRFRAAGAANGSTGHTGGPVEDQATHDIGSSAADLVLPWIRRLLAELKDWARQSDHLRNVEFPETIRIDDR